jgi:hypothetical protein
VSVLDTFDAATAVRMCLSHRFRNHSCQRVSTGLDALDDVLGGRYWGDNVVWELDGAPVDAFYCAIAG